MKLDAKTIYAQSSDIKSRSYLEYRKDMKKKAIIELEIIDWLKDKIKEKYPNQTIKVYKSGGDIFLWFLRKGGISREADFIAEIGNEKIEFELQYAEKTNLNFYDFKVSKVTKKCCVVREPIKNKFFIYIYKPSFKYAIFNPDWILNNGKYGMVDAWRCYAYRVPKEKFEKLFVEDEKLKDLCNIIDIKNFILNFQHVLIEIFKNKLSNLLQSIIDENKIINIIPNNLDSFFKVCFILDNINKIPLNSNLWLIYLLSYINENVSLEEIAKIIFCIDFLYLKINLKENELKLLIDNINKLFKIIKNFYQNDGSFKSSLTSSPIEEIRFALFSINLLEDLTQDIIFYYSVKELKPIKKIYENLPDIKTTYNLIKNQMK